MHSPDRDTPDSPADLHELSVDRNAEIPIGVQLAWALRSRIGDGRLQPGQRLPGLRELAESIGINVNTVRAVYQRLELDGLIASHQGSGTFVTATAQPTSAVGWIAATAAREALETGVDPREVAAALYMAGERPQAMPEGAAADGAQRRRLLRTQIAELERALSEIEAGHPGIAPRDEAGGGALIGPALLNAAELERVRAGLVRRLATVQSAIDERAELQASYALEAQSAKRQAGERGERRPAATAKGPKQAASTDADHDQSAPAKRARKPRGSGKPATAGA